MQKCPVEWKGKLYKYILSFTDVFSRYHWLKPLEIKSPRAVASALKSIYAIHGPPERLQSDDGEEFIHIYYAHLAFVRSKHSVSCGSLITIYVYI